MRNLFATAFLSILCLSLPALAQEPDAAKDYGHSSHGSAFDEGPRQRPWKIHSIGTTHFPITTKVPEVQEWFDQGNTLLHSFWYYEAERAFRWCIKLDPDCAMAYWGLARATVNDRHRFAEILKEAVLRKPLCSERERRWIDAWNDSYTKDLDNPKPARLGWNGNSPELAKKLEEIILDYPDDIEAKANYALVSLFRNGRYGLEAVLQEVLKVNLDHPGAHHYRIHNWDDIQLGDFCLDSCAAYGQIAPQIGHANHMPGHIYTKVGMWHEGAIWLDSATRIEKAYMRERLILPFDAWNYAHNRNFLAYAQSMLGVPSAALQGARDLLNAPLDPKYNKDEGGYSVFRQGLSALRRTLVRFERWEEILAEGSIPWRDTLEDKIWQHYCEAMAHTGLGHLEQAAQQVIALKDMAKEVEGKRIAKVWKILSGEVEGRLRIAKGDTLRGFQILSDAAIAEFKRRKTDNDPPTIPRCLYNVLGELQLDHGSPQLAVGAFQKSLEVLRENGFSLSGLARAYHALGDTAKAKDAYGRMLYIWSAAEDGIWQYEKARALGIDCEPKDVGPAPQRDYGTETLAKLGPNTWQPYMAPQLSAVDVDRNQVTLEQYRGKNVLLVFYLSDQCVHCVEQLHEIKKHAREFATRDTVLLAISSDTPERNASNDLKDLPFTFLSDSIEHANAIRFHSYDEFEEIELHSTNFIDRKGRLRWNRTGGDPFMDTEFLLKEIDRIETIETQNRLQPIGQNEASFVEATNRIPR